MGCITLCVKCLVFFNVSSGANSCGRFPAGHLGFIALRPSGVEPIESMEREGGGQLVSCWGVEVESQKNIYSLFCSDVKNWCENLKMQFVSHKTLLTFPLASFVALEALPVTLKSLPVAREPLSVTLESLPFCLLRCFAYFIHQFCLFCYKVLLMEDNGTWRTAGSDRLRRPAALTLTWISPN